MFGYVRPLLSLLSEEEQNAYQGAYCGLCHALGARYGFLSRFTLNYDFTFLAILFAEEGRADRCLRRCPAHPLRKSRLCLCGSPLDGAADASLILTWYKLRDDVLDKGFFPGLPSRFLSWIYSRPARRAMTVAPDFAAQVEKGLDRLHELEQVRSPELDRAADAFACILKAAAPRSEDMARRRALEQLLYHLGRWIYLADAWDDLEEDREKGSYNPLDARFCGQAGQERDYVATTMTHSLKLAISAANLVEFGQWDSVIQHMLYQGLPAVQEAVLSGRWKELKKQHRETKVNERSVHRAGD